MIRSGILEQIDEVDVECHDHGLEDPGFQRLAGDLSHKVDEEE